MKARHLIMTGLLLLTGISASAQMELGVKCGFGASWIPHTQLIGYERIMPHNGFSGGLVADYLFDYVSLQAELLYAAKGHSDRSYQDGKYSRDLNYLNLPLYCGYRITDRMTIMAGPELGYLLSCDVRQDDDKWDGKSDCYPFNIGIAAQFNFMITDHFGFDVKGYYGLSKTFSVPYTTPDGVEHEDKGRNAGFQISLCYKFELD